MWVNGWQSLLVQLIPHNGHHPSHPQAVVRPITDHLHAVGQVTERVVEVRFELEGHLVGLHCLRDLSGILVDRGQVGMGIREPGNEDLSSVVHTGLEVRWVFKRQEKSLDIGS